MNDAISRLPIFRMVPPHMLTQAIEIAMTPFEVGPGETLLVEGESDDSLMVVLSGKLEVLVDDIPIAMLGPGELVGDMALFSRDPRRTASVVTREPCSLVLIEKTGIDALRAHGNALVPVLETQALRTIGKRLRSMDEAITDLAHGTELEAPPQPATEGLFNRLKGLFGGTREAPEEQVTPKPWEVLKNSPAFRSMEAEELAGIAELMTLRKLEIGEVLLREGEHGRDAYVLASGQMDVYRTTRSLGYEKVAEMKPGSFFGLVSMVHGSVRTASCVAGADTWVLCLPEAAWSQISEGGTPESEGLRRALYDSLSDQLHNANHHVAYLKKHLAGGAVGEREREHFGGLLEHTL